MGHHEIFPILNAPSGRFSAIHLQRTVSRSTNLPVASAISTHSVQASPRISHDPSARGIGGRGHGDGNEGGPRPDFGEVLRGQAGVVSQPGIGVAKPGSVPGSGQVTEKASGKSAEKGLGQTNGAEKAPVANQVQIKEAMKAKAAAGQMDSPSAQLQALSKSGTQAADGGDVQAVPLNAAESKALEKLEKGDNAKLSLPGADAGDGKAVKGKSGKDGKSDEVDKADKIIAAQTSAEKPLQVPVQAASLAAAAAAPISVPLRPTSQKSAEVERVVSSRASNATAPAAKSASGQQVQKSAKGTAETTGKIQGDVKGAGLPMPDVSPAPEGAQPATDLTGDADSAEVPDEKGAGKQDATASASKLGSEVVPQAKHLNSLVPAAVHSAQVAQAVVGGPGETAAHISTLPQNFAGISSPVVGALHGTVVSGVSPYDRIDQGAAPVVLHAGAQQVAVGVHDPSLGWVEIKTQSAAGHVDATLVASSGQTHDALAAQLPAISQFLEQRDVRVGTLVVNHQSAGAGNGTNHFGSGSGGGANAQHAGPGYSGNGGNGGNSGNSGGERRGSQYNAPVPARHSVPVTGAGGESSATARPLSYISVRA